MDFDQQVLIKQMLLESCQILTERHLYSSARWSSEALNGMPQFTQEQRYAEFQLLKRNSLKISNSSNNLTSPLSSSVIFESNNSTNSAIGLGTGTNLGTDLVPSASQTVNNLSTNVDMQNTSTYNINIGNDNDNFIQFIERDKISLASSYFNCKEFNRCHHILKECKSAKAVFIRLYALYLSGEKKKSLENGTILGQNDSNTQNPYLAIIIKELEEYKINQKQNHLNDPFLLYLQGIIYLKSKKLSQAQEMFYQSLSLYPINWSCWKELISSLSTFSDALQIINRFQKNSKFSDKKGYYIMFLFFKITVYQEFFQISNEILNNLNDLNNIFPNFSFLKTQKALLSYNELDYTTAENIFDDILKLDPMRLDEMDIYSNILYVMENKSKLSYLAHYAYEVDPLRPETCCIIANYHSIKFDHQKAIMYYKRALSLNQDCLSAWTLMGHEFVELKNSNAAIESYRRAVDTNNKDFRAWYGLGQAYEVLDMHLYSLYYYQRACSLKPMDKRMWQAIGNCCEKLEEYEDAIKAYKKASSVSIDSDPMILYKLGTLYFNIDDIKNAKIFMKLCLHEELNGDITDETTKARLWLAKHEVSNKNWQMAYNYAIELTQGTSQEIEEARSIAREARMKINITSNSRQGFL
jgi:tetratricopeptide (TPR) repeat protein